MIAVRVLCRLELGIVAAATWLFVMLAAQPHRPRPLVKHDVSIRADDDLRPSAPPAPPRESGTVCDRPHVTNIVIRGRASNQGHFAIQIPGVRHVYGAITDEHGYFELRIPRDDFDEDLCRVPEGHSFADSEMSLSYQYDVE